MRRCVCTYIHTYIYMYTYIYTYIYILSVLTHIMSVNVVESVCLKLLLEPRQHLCLFRHRCHDASLDRVALARAIFERPPANASARSILILLLVRNRAIRVSPAIVLRGMDFRRRGQTPRRDTSPDSVDSHDLKVSPRKPSVVSVCCKRSRARIPRSLASDDNARARGSKRTTRSRIAVANDLSLFSW
jgi:hypothetical protein